MSESCAPRRFASSARLRRSQRQTESKTKTASEFRFSSIDNDDGGDSSNATQEAFCGTIRGHEYLARGNKQNHEDQARDQLVSEISSLTLTQDQDSNPEVATVLCDPLVIRDAADLEHRLESIQDRCITRNLMVAGLGCYESDQEDQGSGMSDPNATMITGEPMLIGTILNIENQDRQARYVAILLSEGADPNAKDPSGKTALMFACAGGHERAAKVLLNFEKTDLLARDEDGNTALMYAAAVGNSKILKYYLKALRKCERVTLHQRRSVDESGVPDATQATRQKAVPTNGGPRAWFLSEKDPLDIQNTQGVSARSLALKSGHLECASLLNEERLRRSRDLNKRLNSVSHHRDSGSPTARTAKTKARRVVPHSSSFDSVYYDQDQSDDDALSRPAPVARNRGRLSQPASTATSAHVVQAERNRRHLVLRKRYQSNPDLCRLRASGSVEASHEEPPIEEEVLLDTHSDGDSEDRDGSFVYQSGDTASPKRRQTLQGDVDPKPNSEKRTQRLRKYSTFAPTSTQPSRKLHPSRMDDPGPSTKRKPSTKRNLTEKLASLLRRRPKNVIPTVDAGLSDPLPAIHPKPMVTRGPQARPSPMARCRSSDTDSGDDCDEDVRVPRSRQGSGQESIYDGSEGAGINQGRKCRSRPMIATGAAVLQSCRKPSPNATATPQATTQALKEEGPPKRRSVDISPIPAFRSQSVSSKAE